MGKPIRVAMIMGKMIGGGVEAVVLNYYQNINRENIQFDFIIDSDSTVVPDELITGLGGRIYRISPYQHLRSYQRDLTALFKKNKYLIVHSHINAISVFPLRIAKKCGIPIRIAHNHSTAAPGETRKNILKSILRIFSKKYPTHYMAPTRYAGEWLFGSEIADNELYILKNAVDVELFSYNKIVREEMRNKLGYRNEDIVIGNIGRMVWQKNQKFVIEVFNELQKTNKNYRLVLIGDGPLKKSLMQQCQELGIENLVTFIKNSNQIADYYQAMDCFLFPSNYEGLGMVAVEAQIAGLPVIASTQVPVEAKISDNFKLIDLKEKYPRWVKMIDKSVEMEIRCGHKEEASKEGYSILLAASKLNKQYVKLLKDIDYEKSQ
ncbi:MAG: glycosyltransferase [Enterococcus italicus]|uniref:glycosyltransferase n=1 Tax=Enterococcus italicus TaxID=246144 RepID=UPI00399586CB